MCYTFLCVVTLSGDAGKGYGGGMMNDYEMLSKALGMALELLKGNR